MNATYAWFAAVLLVILLAGMGRIVRGPTRADRMLGAQLSGTGGAALLILLKEAGGGDSLLDIALVLTLLGAMASIAFTRRAWAAEGGK